MTVNYYQLLKVEQNATGQQIKIAYRKMALQYHPDRNPNDEAAAKKFRLIRVAYETLIHPEKRKQYDALVSGKLSLKYGNHVFSRKAFQSIKIIVKNRIITTDDVFEVIIHADFSTTQFKLQGLQSFVVIEGPEFFRKENSAQPNQPMMQVKYKLKAKSTGYLAIGPASLMVKNISYESDVVFVKSNEPGIIPVNNKKNETMILRFGFGVILCILGLTVYNINEYGFKSFNLDNITAEKINYRSLKTGYSPYAYYYTNTEKTEVESQNLLRIKNTPKADAVVFLIEKKNNTVARNHYIKAGEQYEIKFIPDGEYYVKVMLGNDWNEDKISAPNNRLRGGFEQPYSFEVFDHPNQLLEMKQYDVDSTVKHSVYEISLTPIADGNAKSSVVNESAFFE
jgi:hypothetical protein